MVVEEELFYEKKLKDFYKENKIELSDLEEIGYRVLENEIDLNVIMEE